MRSCCIAGKSILITLLAAVAAVAAQPAVAVVPERVELDGNFARAQLLVRRPHADGIASDRSNDLTTQAIYESSDHGVVTVNAAGQLVAVGNGEAKVTVAVNESRVEVPVTVRGAVEQPEVGFSQSIRPILNKAGCALAACHAAQHG
ncbi:MAG TPA: hypothetical protein VKH44_06120, partial [Pirellulaceae bacterium]|nr:hypothetical protein [Pirellulaceae bacterium]